MKEFSNSFYPRVIFIKGVVEYGKIPSEILLSSSNPTFWELSDSMLDTRLMLSKNISLMHNLYRFWIIFRYYGWWYQPTTSHRWSNIKFPAEVNNPLITAYFTCAIILKQIGKLYVPKKCAPHKPTYLLTTVWITKVVTWKDNLKKESGIIGPFADF